MINSIITGVGSYIPKKIKKNKDFLQNEFLDANGELFPYNNEKIIEKFKSITGIEERRYADDKYTASDLAYFASQKAIEKSNINPEDLDYIIFGHNYGNVSVGSTQPDVLPSLASRVKHSLEIENPNCVAYDIIFGCPGWVQGLIQAHIFIQSGVAKKCLVIGGETLSRVSDPNDRDSMIYADGAGACIVEAVEQNDKQGVLNFAAQTYTKNECYHLFSGKTYCKKAEQKDNLYIKMYGRKIYEFALKNVPLAIKSSLEKSNVAIDDVKKIFIHQANEKMDEAIVHRFYKLYGKTPPKDIMPMCIHKLGNSSVATVPTLFDLVLENKIENQHVSKGDTIVFASVGAGMNINAVVYKM